MIFTKSGLLSLAYNQDTAYVVKQVTAAWEKIRAGMKRLFPASTPRPFSASEIFVPDDNAANYEVKLIIKPIIFHLPERAGRQANLYIVLSG